MNTIPGTYGGAPGGLLPPSEFFPVARYHPEMDIIQYLKEDCSYRAERTDGILTILWAPYEDRVVGIALKGFRALFQLFKTKHPDVSEDMFLPLVGFIRAALENGAADGYMGEAEDKRRQRYEIAQKFAATVGIRAYELKEAA